MITAALDIGSNSIHLVVVETDREKPFRIVASAKEAVRLGRSSARDQRLSAALTYFSYRLKRRAAFVPPKPKLFESA
jgi:exopolyphosphatase/pppGpp-phosphohydrolase